MQLNYLEQKETSANARNVNGNNGNCNNNSRSNTNTNNRVLAVSDFSQGFTLQEITDAYFDCRKHKRWTFESIEFELKDWVQELKLLLYEINNRSYKIGTSICFIVTKPKVREVFAGNFRDRTVHHLIINALEPYFENYFIENCYSCRRNKGTLYGQIDVYNQMKTISKNYTKSCYICKLDCQSYFMSIDKNILWDKLNKFITEQYFQRNRNLLLWLIKQVIFHSPQNNCIIKGDKNLWNILPKNKSLFYVDYNKGLPIGNLTSQWFGNFYLTDYDKWAKNNSLGYGRYVDDIISIHKSLKDCRTFYKESKKFLSKDSIVLNPNKIYIQYYLKGVTFIGAVLKAHRVYVSNNILSNFYNKLYNFNYKGLESYFGLFKHYKSKKEILKIIMKQENNIYFADEGKIFQRIYDGFKKIVPQGQFSTLQLGKILVDSDGNKLKTPIEDKIQYYEEVELMENVTNT